MFAMLVIQDTAFQALFVQNVQIIVINAPFLLNVINAKIHTSIINPNVLNLVLLQHSLKLIHAKVNSKKFNQII